MRALIQKLGIGLVISVLAVWAVAAQKQDTDQKAALQDQADTPRTFGQSYSALRPAQKELIDNYVRRYNTTTSSDITSVQLYDGARISVRTTFDAVTHALLKTTLTDKNGHSLGRAIDLIDGLDEVAGAEEGAKGDRQFRMYVYLKPMAFDTLANSREFGRDKDNTVYHKGFPICFRLKKGPPSIQFSISRDQRMADIDVDYRSSAFPKALFNGHLSAGNSDVRAGNNLDTHDNRWAGLDGWWREVFGFYLPSSKKPSDDTTTGRVRTIPLTPRLKAKKGIDASVHDFLKAWLVEKQSNQAVAYLSRRSYPCLEKMAEKSGERIPDGMLRIRTVMAMDKFNASTGNVTSVSDVVEADNNWSPRFKAAKNAYPAEFRLVKVPSDMARDQECAQASSNGTGKASDEEFYTTVFRVKRGDSRGKVMLYLWTKEESYWKIVAVRIEDSGSSGLAPHRTAVGPSVPVSRSLAFAGDPVAIKEITSFYQEWLIRRDTSKAALYASKRSYKCIAPPSSAEERKLTPVERIQRGLNKTLEKIPKGSTLSELTEGVPPVNDLVRPVKHKDSTAFDIMAVPDQLADSFLCQQELSGNAPQLTANDAKYGTYYLSATQLRYGAEESPALLLLWTKENNQWKVISWTVAVP